MYCADLCACLVLQSVLFCFFLFFFVLFVFVFVFFFQAEDGIRDTSVTGVQTCALPICQFVNLKSGTVFNAYNRIKHRSTETIQDKEPLRIGMDFNVTNMSAVEIGRASCRERV